MLRLLIYSVIAVGLIRIFETRNIFFPVKNIDLTPADTDLKFREVYLKTADNIDIHGWFIPYDGARFTILIFHGKFLTP